jgi:hypothetical protein
MSNTVKTTVSENQTIINLLTEIRDLLKAGGQQQLTQTLVVQPTPPETFATFTKMTTGEFGIKTPTKPEPNAVVDVMTRNGRVMKRRVKAILTELSDSVSGKKAWLCSVYDRDQAAAPAVATR